MGILSAEAIDRLDAEKQEAERAAEEEQARQQATAQEEHKGGYAAGKERANELTYRELSRFRRPEAWDFHGQQQLFHSLRTELGKDCSEIFIHGFADALWDAADELQQLTK